MPEICRHLAAQYCSHAVVFIMKHGLGLRANIFCKLYVPVLLTVLLIFNSSTTKKRIELTKIFALLITPKIEISITHFTGKS